MYNSQLKRLNQSILSQGKPKRPYAVFEPMVLGPKKRKKMKKGVWIELGSSLPNLYIVKNHAEIYAAELGIDDGLEAIWVQEMENVSFDETEIKKGAGLLEIRLAVFPEDDLETGSIVRFGWSLTNNLVLTLSGVYAGSGSLLSYEKGYVVDVTEWLL